MEIPDLINKINNSRFTRIPFWKENQENIIGLLNVRSLNIDLSTSDSSKELIFEKINKPWFIPETTNLLDQLVEFKKRKEHLAFVVDEYGELLGLITLEDIIEEIVGEIVDEIDIPSNEFYINNRGVIITNGENNLKDIAFILHRNINENILCACKPLCKSSGLTTPFFVLYPDFDHVLLSDKSSIFLPVTAS